MPVTVSRVTRILVVGDNYGAIITSAAQLALGAKVTLLSPRTPDEIRGSAVLSSQALFGAAPEIEAALGLRGAFPPSVVPQISTVRISVGSGLFPPTIQWHDALSPPASSIDHRDWLPEGFDRVAACGARIEHFDWPDHHAVRDDLTRRARTYDLIIVTSARLGDAVFPPDPAFGPPAVHRRVQMAYVRGGKPAEPHTMQFAVATPDAAGHPYGEAIVVPALSRGEPVTIVFLEGHIGGAWDDRTRDGSAQWEPPEVWARMQRILPGDLANRFEAAELADPGGVLRGQVTQCARYPLVAIDDTPVLALGDAAMTLDPVSAQGACKAALDAQDAADALRPGRITPQVLTDLIGRIGHRNLSMWRYTNALLSPPESVRATFAAAHGDATLRRLLVSGFCDPTAMEGTSFYGVVPEPEGPAA
jgi:hypothetical protein